MPLALTQKDFLVYVHNFVEWNVDVVGVLNFNRHKTLVMLLKVLQNQIRRQRSANSAVPFYFATERNK